MRRSCSSVMLISEHTSCLQARCSSSSGPSALGWSTLDGLRRHPHPIERLFLEAGDRAKERHYRAWDLINSARGSTGDGGRKDALQDLNKDRVSLARAPLDRANLVKINLEGALLMEANLEGAHLEGAHLEQAKLGERTLRAPTSRERTWKAPTS